MGLKGAMAPLKGSMWTMKEPLSPIEFKAPTGLDTAPQEWLNALKQALEDDMSTEVSGVCNDFV